MSPAITKRVTDSIRLLEPGARIRDVAKLSLPCGFRLDPTYGSNLVLRNGTEIRRYVENNPFGFAPAFGFSEQTTKSYTLSYRTVTDSDLHSFSCAERIKGAKGAPQLCSSFGSDTSFFGATPTKRGTHLAHYLVNGSAIREDFAVADIKGRVDSIFFLPPPDAPGGTITVVLTDTEGTYRAFVDTPRG